MVAGDAARVVARLWELFEARRWDEARELLHEDLVVDWPHTRERFRGRDAFVAMNSHYPEPWSIRVLRVAASPEGVVVAEVAVTHPDGVSRCASVAEVTGGRIAHATEYWVDEGQEAPLKWRARWAESAGPFRQGP